MKTILKSPILVLLVLLTTNCLQLLAIPLAGNYSINSGLPTGGMNFQNFTDFASSINTNGISANVVVTVEPNSGPYNEQIVINTVSGASASATVTLEGNGETLSALTTTANRHVFRLSNVSYFTINNLHIDWNPASTGGFYGIHIFGTGNFITISNCSVDLSGTISTLYGAYVASGSETSILSTGDFHNISFINNTATGGGYGISVFGLLNNLASNILIDNNNIFDYHSNGIYLRETNGAIISNNKFDKRTSQVTTANAIQIAQAANRNARIFNNYFSVSQLSNGTSTLRGIYLFDGTGHRVYNNVFYNINLTSGNFTAIEIRSAATAPEIYYNTISLDNPNAGTGNLYAIKEELSNTNSILRNNLISISQATSGTKAGLVIGAVATVTSAFNSNYNVIWVPGGHVAQKNSTSPTNYTTLAAWQGASNQDANSPDQDPWLSPSPYPIPSNPAVDDAGIAIGSISTDILGVLRGSSPDIGAYEWTPVGLPGMLPSTALSVHMNTLSGTLDIHIPENVHGNLVYEIYSLNGKLAGKGFIELIADRKIFKIPVQELSTGTYLVRLLSDTSVLSSKFVR